MFILEIPLISPTLSALCTAGRFSACVAGGIISGCFQGIAGDPTRIKHNVEMARKVAPDVENTLPTSNKVYRALSRNIKEFCAEGNLNIKSTKSLKELKDITGSWFEAFLEQGKSLKLNGTTMRVAGIAAAVGLVGFGAVQFYNYFLGSYDKSVHNESGHIVKNENYHAAVGTLGLLMALSVPIACIPRVGRPAIGIGLVLGAVSWVLTRPFVQKTFANHGFFQRPDYYVPGRLGTGLTRWINPTYRG